jgi:8-oxo-dGTP pyrophosphatase MutT (NUDIX family)
MKEAVFGATWHGRRMYAGKFLRRICLMKVGAGVIPFAVVERELLFLFQTVFSGRKAGHLIDFGGGTSDGESSRHCAIREFIEETETMYFADDPARATRTEESVMAQMPVIELLFNATLSDHPDWWCRRTSGIPLKLKDWQTFFVEFPYRNPEVMNLEWQNDRKGRFKKRRELRWISAGELISLYAFNPERLWKRVRQLEGAPELISRIQRIKCGDSDPI